MHMSFQGIPFIPRETLRHLNSALPDSPVVPYQRPVLRDHARDVIAGACDRLAFLLLRLSHRIEPSSLHPDRLTTADPSTSAGAPSR